jgi:hypothetical protein
VRHRGPHAIIGQFRTFHHWLSFGEFCSRKLLAKQGNGDWACLCAVITGDIIFKVRLDLVERVLCAHVLAAKEHRVAIHTHDRLDHFGGGCQKEETLRSITSAIKIPRSGIQKRRLSAPSNKRSNVAFAANYPNGGVHAGKDREDRSMKEGKGKEGRMGRRWEACLPDFRIGCLMSSSFSRDFLAIYHRVLDFPAEQMNIQLKFEDSSTGAKSNVHLMPCEIDHDGIAKVGSGDGGH